MTFFLLQAVALCKWHTVTVTIPYTGIRKRFHVASPQVVFSPLLLSLTHSGCYILFWFHLLICLLKLKLYKLSHFSSRVWPLPEWPCSSGWSYTPTHIWAAHTGLNWLLFLKKSMDEVGGSGRVGGGGMGVEGAGEGQEKYAQHALYAHMKFYKG